ncbi:MAG: hypothetical protein BWY09_01199 [Candidatus Hydrogenedentes bacterium ADurb.Bin179]|nr:MAG: hypothetical protein BWY09_01199 [Candidatus Hydrogenedentes bacterium ADurb.Bin179]
MQSVYIETSIISYMTARPSRDVRVAAWQQLTAQWWARERKRYELFASELVRAESAEGDQDAAQRRLEMQHDVPVLLVDEESETLAKRLIDAGGFPATSESDALHVAVAAVHGVDYLLTWNCRPINNAATKPIVRSICVLAGYRCPEICTPQELLLEDSNDVSR